MACRIGMSTDPEERIRYWKNTEGHTGHNILATGLLYHEAQIFEQDAAKDKGCRQEEGGQYIAGAVWSVYHVWGGR